jgi:hypothetical protein
MGQVLGRLDFVDDAIQAGPLVHKLNGLLIQVVQQPCRVEQGLPDPIPSNDRKTVTRQEDFRIECRHLVGVGAPVLPEITRRSSNYHIDFQTQSFQKRFISKPSRRMIAHQNALGRRMRSLQLIASVALIHLTPFRRESWLLLRCLC